MNKDPLRTKKYKLRQLKREQGQKFPIDLVSAEPARERILAARERGLTWDEISRLTGIPSLRAQKIGRGQVKRIQRQNAAKVTNGLCEHDSRSIQPNTLVPIPEQYYRMVRSLMAQGWTVQHMKQIIRQNGKGSGWIIIPLTNPAATHDRVQRRHLDQFRWLMEVIGDKTGPGRSAKAMQRKGIFPLKHYTAKGNLNVSTLTPEQRQYVR